MTSTRLGGLVVKNVGSCLGVVSILGMIDRGYGIVILLKRRVFDQIRPDCTV